MTEKQVRDLTASIKKFNFVEIPVINTNNKIISGHQRLKIMALLGRGQEVIDVRVPNRELTKKETDEYMVRSNKNTAGWDFDILANVFTTEELQEYGFTTWDLGLGGEDPQGEDEVVAQTYKVEIELSNAEEQDKVFDELAERGLNCKKRTRKLKKVDERK